jgi:hypothetical protein
LAVSAQVLKDQLGRFDALIAGVSLKPNGYQRRAKATTEWPYVGIIKTSLEQEWSMELEKPHLGHHIAECPFQRCDVTRPAELVGISSDLEIVFDLSYRVGYFRVHLLGKIKLISAAVNLIDHLTMKFNEAQAT